MNKKVIYFLRRLVALIMVTSDLKKKVIILLILLSVFSFKSYSNIIYDKNNIIITEIELKQFKNLYLETKKTNLNQESAIKNLVLQRKVINELIKTQPEIIKKIDDVIISEFGRSNYENKITRDFLRYIKIRNEFIIDYFNKDLNIDEVRLVLSNFNNFKLPISNNNCLTFLKSIDMRENASFIESFYSNFKNKTSNYRVKINGDDYYVCISSNDFALIESEIIKYIENITQNSFNMFIYGK